MNDTVVLYYGVYIPSEYEGASALDGDERIFTNKTEALVLLKKFKGRLKSFHERNQALTFACSGVDVVDKGHSESESSSLLGEKPSLFKGPKSQDLVQLRKAIESGTISFTHDLIWKNPRYLISSGDTPTILQEGSRYNGLHVACKAKRPDMCGLILEAISDAAFLRMLYPDDTPMIREDRILFLLDLYLNMPDKALNETPLHFASKYGCAACVELLVNYPQCNRHRRNKYEQTPRDMICTRVVNKPSPDLVATVEVLLGDRYFVPVLRSEDWSTQPSIGEPWSPDVSREPTLIDVNLNRTPQSSASRVMAYAGPMSPSDARRFYQQWKTPPARNLTPRRPATPGSSTPTTALNSDAKLRDPDKGLETVGRLVAKGMGVKWQEYWPFLDAFCDISSEAGLVAFEQYLKSRLLSILKTPSLEEVTQKLERLICHEQSSSPIKLSPRIPIMSPMSDLCIKLSSLHLEGTHENPIETHQSVDMVDRGLIVRQMNFVPEQHTLIGDKLLAKVSKLTGGLENEQACQSLEGILLTEFRGHQSLVSHTELANTLFRCLQATYDTSGFGKLLTKWLNSTEEDEHLATAYARCVMGSVACLCSGGKVDVCQRAVPKPEDSNIQRRLFQESECFETPRTSPIDSPETVTPDEIENIFVNGSQMTKADLDVWRALEDVPIDAMRFPMIAMWKQAMMQSKEELKQLETPRGTHLKLKIPASGSLQATPTRRITVSATGSPVSSLPPLLLGLSDSKSRLSLPRTRLRL